MASILDREAHELLAKWLDAYDRDDQDMLDALAITSRGIVKANERTSRAVHVTVHEPDPAAGFAAGLARGYAEGRRSR